MRIPLAELVRQHLEKKGTLEYFDFKITGRQEHYGTTMYQFKYKYENGNHQYLELTSKKLRELKRVGVLG